MVGKRRLDGADEKNNTHHDEEENHGNSTITTHSDGNSTMTGGNTTTMDEHKHEDEEDGHTHDDEMMGTTSELKDHDHEEEEEKHSREGTSKLWGVGIGAALVVNLTSLAAVVLLIPLSLFKKSDNGKKLYNTIVSNLIPSFACGALLATAFFLIFPESLLLLGGGEEAHEEEDGHGHRFLSEEEEAHKDAHGEEESGAAWKFGVAVLAGYLIPLVFGTIFSHHHHRNDDTEQKDEKKEYIEGEKQEESDIENTKVTEKSSDEFVTVPIVKDYRLAGSLTIGDFFHNFADGIFIGNAFLLCSNTVAWTLAATTIVHELPQEICDYSLLVNHCGFSPLMALLLNFTSGLSVVLGVVVIFAADVSPQVTGIILALSGGVYIFIAASECQGRVEKAITCAKQRLLSVLMFCLGALPVGLVLLNHSHCS